MIVLATAVSLSTPVSYVVGEKAYMVVAMCITEGGGSVKRTPACNNPASGSTSNESQRHEWRDKNERCRWKEMLVCATLLTDVGRHRNMSSQLDHMSHKSRICSSAFTVQPHLRRRRQTAPKAKGLRHDCL